MTRGIVLISALLICITARGQFLNITGTIRTLHGERLPSAQIFVRPDSTTIISDNEGSFQFQSLPGKKWLTVSYVGFEKKTIAVTIGKDTTIPLLLHEKLNALQAVEIEGLR